ncbi:MAG: DNA mismatch repair protein MutS [Polyangia bacterium]
MPSSPVDADSDPSSLGAAEHTLPPQLADAGLAEGAEAAEPPGASDPLAQARPARARTAIPAVDTPVMRQYLEVKERYPDCIVFFRLGDFYEMFFDDAVVVSQLLDLTLTARDKNKEVPVPMCGVPHHAAKHYVAKLIALGKKVAICDQVEDARKAKKIVRRAVTQVITPGVILEEEQLEPKAGHYLLALAPLPARDGSGDRVGLAYLDASTGEFAATELGEAEALEEALRIEPAEALVVAPAGPGTSHDALGLAPGAAEATSPLVTALVRRLRIPVGISRSESARDDQALLTGLLTEEPAAAGGAGARAKDKDRDKDRERDKKAEAGEPALTDAPPRASDWPLALAAAAACVRYARATQPAGGLPLFRLRLYRPADSLIIDESTKTNLELLATLMERKRQGSLLSVIDHTRTAMGGRLLRRWLLQPLMQLGPIRRRHDAVEFMVERQAARHAAREALKEIHDLERLTGRLVTQQATPRDLAALQHSLSCLPRLVQLVSQAAAPTGTGPGAALEALAGGLPPLLDLGSDLCADLREHIAAAIVDSPPVAFREGGFIRRGFSAELDELTDLSQGGKDHIQRIEERERERSGITSLKVRYNKVFGYYIEITRANLARVPADYIRKQTTVNAERFVTTELAEYEAKVLGAEERRIELELQLFESLRQALAPHSERLLALAQRVAQLDALCGLGELAHRHGYVRPQMTSDLRTLIEDGRHPVVEQVAERGRFVPNDTALDPDSEQLLILTGPNMAGKSTVMRQVALICILGQMGSFVPAHKAELGIVDRVCTRVGASDNLSRGESTFMVEMRETSQILRRATRRSLVVLDEIGRGTSTYDGVSIAWAVAEYLHDVIGCKTLFATHYHELCALAAARPRARNFSVAVRQYQGDVVFLHKLVPGGANRSYGLEVAKLAGLPKSVLVRAREILHALESAQQREGQAALPVHGVPPLRAGQLSLLLGEAVAAQPTPLPPPPQEPARSAAEDEVLLRLNAVDCDELSPRAALDLVSALCASLRRGSK